MRGKKLTCIPGTKAPTIAILVLGVLCCHFSAFGQNTPIIIENQRELFVDDHLLETLENADIRLGTPVSGGVAMEFKEPWEGQFCAYVSIVNDGRFFHMYYRGMAGYENKGDQEVTCYATSVDGIHWKKPNLGLFKINGTWNNNVVMPDNPQTSTHNFTVLYDTRQGVPKEAKFKAVGGHSSGGGLYRYISEDGVHWKRYQDTTALFPDFALDSQNVLAWVPSENSYAIYMRTWTEAKPGKPYGGTRTIARSVSKDFTHWSKPERMTFGNTEIEHLYTNTTHPYFRAPQILIAMPFRFSPKKQVLSEEELTRLDVDPTQRKGVSDAVFMTSRGGNVYDRKFLTSFIRAGSDQRNWAARSNQPSLGVIPTGETEMSFFVTRAYGTRDIYLERMKLRKDGFAAIHGGFEEGFAITKPVLIRGNTFRANYATSANGYIKIVFLDEKGREIPGFGEKEASDVIGDKIDGKVTWKGGKTLAELTDKKVRIKFIVKDADIYSFGISEE